MGAGAALRPGHPGGGGSCTLAGIVAESDPELEHTETGTKLGSWLRSGRIPWAKIPFKFATNAFDEAELTTGYDD